MAGGFLARRCLLALLAAALAGCAILGAPAPDYGAGLPASRPERVEQAEVPFFPQEDYQCGPAALATILHSAGFPRTPAQLVDQVYLPERQGSLQVELLGASRRAGALPYVLRPVPAALLQEVAAGHPVVVLQDVGLLRTQWHYAVVVGYDLTQGTLVLRSGTQARQVLSFQDFDRTWARSERWALVALPPGRLPASAGEAEYLQAAAAFERVQPDAAARAFQAALDRWPDSLFARLALGNAAYRRHELAAAQAQYQQATRDHPEAGDAWNNLAQVLYEQGRVEQAEQAARRAVALGGPRLERYKATLAAIERQQTRTQTSPSP